MIEKYRVAGTLMLLSGLALGVSGCMGPRYGTDTTATAQLVEDLGNSVTLTPPKQESVVYQPRGALVKPADNTLVAPEKNLASKDNPQWVESPEEARLRLKAEADANKDNSTYRSPLARSVTEGKAPSQDQQAAAFREARKIQEGRYSDRRLFTSDPPLEYRKVEDPSKLSDLGEPEADKEKRRKKEAEIAGTGTHWWEVWK